MSEVMPPIFVLSAAKGGSGKTTLAVNLAHALSRIVVRDQPKRVLVIDLDAQGNATNLLGYDDGTFPEASSIKRILNGHAATPVSAFDVQLVGHNEDAAAMMQLLANAASMRSFLNGVRATINVVQPDYVVIDTPPLETPAGGIGALAGSHVIIPLQPHRHGLAGALRAQQYVAELCADGGSHIHVAGVVPIMTFRCAAIEHILAEASEHFGSLMTEPIPLRSVILESSLVGMPVVAFETYRCRELDRTGTFFDRKKKLKYSEVGTIFDRIATRLLRTCVLHMGG